MHNVIKEIKPSSAQYYQGNQTKRWIVLSRKSNQTMDSVIKKIKPNDG